MSYLILGSSLQKHESVLNEYKEFCLKDNVYKYLTHSEVSLILRRGILPPTFNELTLINLFQYLDKYVPKYITSFHNTSKNTAKLRIGIDDFCEITGIPFQGNLKNHYMHIQRHIEHIIMKHLNILCCVEYKLIIRKCKIDFDFLEDNTLKDALTRFDDTKKWYDRIIKEYMVKKQKWNSDILKYKGKLQNIFYDDDLKHEFYEYLMRNGKLESFKNVIDNSNEKSITTNDVKRYKYDKTHFICWLIRFKEEKVLYLMKSKPKRIGLQKLFNTEFCQITQLSNLRKRLLTRNSDLRYYVIDIIIKYDTSKHCSGNISFYDTRSCCWRTTKRQIVHMNPQCVECE